MNEDSNDLRVRAHVNETLYHIYENVAGTLRKELMREAWYASVYRSALQELAAYPNKYVADAAQKVLDRVAPEVD